MCIGGGWMPPCTRLPIRYNGGMSPTIILASTSPYRAQLLQRLQVEFVTRAPPVDEVHIPGEPPKARAQRLAQEKAETVAHQYATANPAAHFVVVGGDQTIADSAHCIYDKPGTRKNAITQLLAMRGKTLFFYTAVSVYHSAAQATAARLVEHTVTARNFDEAEVERYVSKEAALNCAGGVQVEGLGISLMDSIQGGDPTALIGMPLIAVADLLRAANIAIP